MKNLTSHNSNYKISDRNGSEIGIYNPELKKMIIGIPKDFDIKSDDTMLLLDSQVLCVDIPNYFTRLFQLPNDARNTVEKAVKFLVDNNKSKVHMGRNLESVVNHSFNRSGLHLSKLIKSLFTICNDEELTIKTATLDKAMKTPTFRMSSQLLSGYICAFNMINPTFCKDGKGSIYVFNNRINEFSSTEIEDIGTKYNNLVSNAYENALDRYNKGDNEINLEKIFNIKKILDDELDLAGAYEEWEIHSMYRYIHFDKNYSDLIQAMLS